MSDTISGSSVGFFKCNKHDWLIALVIFLLLWGMCIGSALLFSLFKAKESYLPAWAGTDVKSTAVYDKKSPWIAEGDIFAAKSFSYWVEENDLSEASKSSVISEGKANGEMPKDSEDNEGYYGKTLPKVLSCGEAKGNFSDLHKTVNLYHVNVDEPIVRKGDLLYETTSNGERHFTEACLKFMAYQDYCMLQEPVQAGIRYLVRVAFFSALILVFFGYSIFYLREDIYDADRKQWLTFFLISFHLVLLVASYFIYRLFDGLPSFFALMMFPSALVPALMSNMMGRRAGICSAVCLSILCSILIWGDYQFEYMVYSLISSLISILAFQNVHSRIRFMLGGIALALGALIMDIVVAWENNLAWVFQAPFTVFWLYLPIVILINALTVILGMLLLPPVCELIFDVTTVFTLNELNTRDHPLLERLANEAPGTYEHSLSVSDLAVEAAKAIGANSRLAQACGYFHDIGKLSEPKLFAENLRDGEANPHDSMTPEKSAAALLKHVTYGIELAKKMHLPHAVREAIAQHHGTSTMAFFADKAVRLAQEKGGPLPDMDNFRYPGPCPRRIEVLLVSIADVCEAAIRAMVEHGQKATAPVIREKIKSLLLSRFEDGQFANAQLSLSQLQVVIDKLVDSLCTTHHSRPMFPADEKSNETEKEAVSMVEEGERPNSEK